MCLLFLLLLFFIRFFVTLCFTQNDRPFTVILSHSEGSLKNVTIILKYYAKGGQAGAGPSEPGKCRYWAGQRVVFLKY